MFWQADLYRRPLQDEQGNPLWGLVVCDDSRSFTASVLCPQSQVTAAWLTAQLQQLIDRSGAQPTILQVFRPQSVSLLQAACAPLGIAVEPTRHSPALKQILREQAIAYRRQPNYTGQPDDPIALDRPAPLPLPDNLWGDRWRFAAIAAQDLIATFEHRPIPIRDMPPSWLPIALQLASTLPIPGVVIDGGRRSLPLARWLQQVKPVALDYVSGAPDGLLLEAGLVDRWVLTTFEDEQVKAAARTFADRQAAAKGLHFLLVQPDDSGMTYTGFWLLQAE